MALSAALSASICGASAALRLLRIKRVRSRPWWPTVDCRMTGTDFVSNFRMTRERFDEMADAMRVQSRALEVIRKISKEKKEEPKVGLRAFKMKGSAFGSEKRGDSKQKVSRKPGTY